MKSWNTKRVEEKKHSTLLDVHDGFPMVVRASFITSVGHEVGVLLLLGLYVPELNCRYHYHGGGSSVVLDAISPFLGLPFLAFL